MKFDNTGKCRKCNAKGYEGIFNMVIWVCEKCGWKNIYKKEKGEKKCETKLVEKQ